MDLRTRRRVKVYQLNEEGQWDDKGTGHVVLTYHEKFGGVGVVVKSEESDGHLLLESKLYAEDIYQLQQDTLIVWNDPVSSDDLALSFQEAVGCSEIWEQISLIQTRMNSNCDVVELELMALQEEDALQEIPLPVPNVKNIDSVYQFITKSVARRDRIALALTRENYLQKLLDLFKACEDPPNIVNLHKMFEIFKALVLFNDHRIFDVLFSDEYILEVFGAFEYDPEIGNQRIKHRDFLTKKAKFKEVIPFNNDDLVRKIHQTFRIQYLKDVVLPRTLDDATFASLNSLIFYNQLEIITTLRNDKEFFQDLFAKLKSAEINSAQRKDLVLFLVELCTLAKNLVPPNRSQFYSTMISKGLYEVLSTTVGDLDASLRNATTDILNHITTHDPTLLRKYLLTEKPNYTFTRLLINRYLNDTEAGVMALCGDIIRGLFDEEGVGDALEREEFVSIFYKDLFPMLVSPLNYKEDDETAKKIAVTKNQVCEMLSFCLQHHSSRIRRYIFQNGVIEKIVKLIDHKEKFLGLSAIRFIRAIVGTKEEEYLSYLIKHALFDDIVELFFRNGNRYNLLNSSIIELFEFIRSQNLKSMIMHIGSRYGERLKTITYVDTFQRLWAKYEQNLESPPPTSLAAESSKKRRYADTDSDDDYFSRDDDDDDDDIRSSFAVYDDEDVNKNGAQTSSGDSSLPVRQDHKKLKVETPTTSDSKTESSNTKELSKSPSNGDDNNHKDKEASTSSSSSSSFSASAESSTSESSSSLSSSSSTPDLNEIRRT
eukprot:TRINITY_DN1130_c0_g4_i1.p1 TRINITY_DN1130_c0_g4~~TRINITY_DN1130_c0_g4_i1.p1  ORF type:complete len:770 (+),score=129.95 TRINITY_DN1130_c0_g4_i1:601-2910(+)